VTVILAPHPFRRRQLNGHDENGNEGCATCGRTRGAHPVADGGLLDLAHQRLEEVERAVREPDSTLDAVLRRLFDPAERDLLTVSAFSSAL
jgi:hypothetical protein